MPHAHSFYISKTEQHLSELTTYKKPKSDPTQAIRNDCCSTLDFFHSACLVDHRLWNHPSCRGSSSTHVIHLCTSILYGLPKIHISYHCLPHPSFNQQYQHVMSHQPALKLCHPLHINSCRNTFIIHLLQPAFHITLWIHLTFCC